MRKSYRYFCQVGGVARKRHDSRVGKRSIFQIVQCKMQSLFNTGFSPCTVAELQKVSVDSSFGPSLLLRRGQLKRPSEMTLAADFPVWKGGKRKKEEKSLIVWVSRKWEHSKFYGLELDRKDMATISLENRREPLSCHHPVSIWTHRVHFRTDEKRINL